MKVIEAFEDKVIPEKFRPYFPTVCKHCGNDLVINYKLTEMKCPNAKCINKIANRMNRMLEAFGVKGIGESYCLDLSRRCIAKGWESPLGVFILELEDYPRTFSLDVTESKYLDITRAYIDANEPDGLMTFAELIQKISLPNIGETSNLLFSKINDCDELLEVCDSLGGVSSFVCSRLDSCGEQADKLTKTILDYLEDIVLACSIFKLRKSSEKIIKVAITGSISKYGRFTRNEFIKEVNKLGKGIISIADSGALESVRYVIADSNNGSTTYKAGARRKVLIDSASFVDKFLEEVDKYGNN